MNLQEIGLRIRSERKARGETQEEVAELAGISRRTLGQIEQGLVSEIGIRKVMRVMNCLGLEFEVRRESPMPTLDDLNRERAEEQASGGASAVPFPRFR